jgi:hypothetical protein
MTDGGAEAAPLTDASEGAGTSTAGFGAVEGSSFSGLYCRRAASGQMPPRWWYPLDSKKGMSSMLGMTIDSRIYERQRMNKMNEV